MGVGQAKRFDAFISYGHAADGKLAPALQAGLQRLARPWHQRRALRVFRDDTGLSVNPDLWGSICDALDDAEWCILLASPQAAASVWVNQELEHWLADRPRGRILPVLTEGTLVWDPEHHAFDPERSTALPEALRGYFDTEPRHLDLTWARDESQLDLRHSRFRAAVADLAAPIHGVAKDELESEDIRQHRRAVRLRRIAVVALVGLLLLAVLATVVAVAQRNRAIDQARVADSQRLSIQAQSLAGSQLDLALLLASAGFVLDDSTTTRQGLLSVLSAEPQLRAFEHRFGAALSSIAVSPDRRTFAVGGQDGTLRTWDGSDAIGPAVDTGLGVVLETVYTPDGRYLAVSGDEGTQLFDAGLRRVGSLMKTPGATEWVAVSRDGRRLATSSSHGFVGLWRIADGTAIAPPVRVSPIRATGVVFDAAGERALVGTYERTVVSVDARTGRLLPGSFELAGRGSTYALALSPDGKTLATSVEDGSVQLLSATTGDPLRAPLRYHPSQPYSMAFDPSGRLLASADDTGAIAVWETGGGDQPLHTLHGHGELTTDVAFTSRRTLVSLAGGEMIGWDLDGEPLGSRRSADSGPITALAPRPGSDHFLVGGRDGRLTDWTVDGPDSGSPKITTRLARVSAARWSADGAVLVVGGGTRVRDDQPRDGRVEIWSGLQTRRATVSIGSPGVVSLDVSPDGRRLAVGDNGGLVTVWDLETAARVGPPLLADSDRTGANSVAFSPDSRVLLTGGNSGLVTTWRVSDGERLWQQSAGANVNTVAWAGDGSMVVAGGGLAQVLRLRGSDGEPIGDPVAAEVGEISGSDVTADGRLVAVTGFGGRVAVVDVTSGERLYHLAGEPDGRAGVAFVDGGTTLVSTGIRGDVVVRLLDPEAWRQRACREAARPLDAAEINIYLDGVEVDPCA